MFLTLFSNYFLNKFALRFKYLSTQEVKPSKILPTIYKEKYINIQINCGKDDNREL